MSVLPYSTASSATKQQVVDCLVYHYEQEVTLGKETYDWYPIYNQPLRQDLCKVLGVQYFDELLLEVSPNVYGKLLGYFGG